MKNWTSILSLSTPFLFYLGEVITLCPHASRFILEADYISSMDDCNPSDTRYLNANNLNVKFDSHFEDQKISTKNNRRMPMISVCLPREKRLRKGNHDEEKVNGETSGEHGKRNGPVDSNPKIKYLVE